MDVRWKHPWTSIVCGPTDCGKAIFVKPFLRYLSSDVHFERVLFYYAEWQDAYRQLEYDVCIKEKEEREEEEEVTELRRNVKEEKEEYNQISRGIILYTRSENYLSDPLFPKLIIIIDDLIRESSCDVIADLFIKGSHHKYLSVIFISQNLFHQGRGQRDISFNANYIVVFKNPRNRAQIRHLPHQVYPDDPKFLEEAYYYATSRPHGHFLLDLKQSIPDEYRFRMCIFLDDTTH